MKQTVIAGANSGTFPPGEPAVKPRLIDLKQIRVEKIERSPAWFYDRIAKRTFPKPLPLGNTSKNLWEEAEVDRWLADFIANAKASVHDDVAATKRTTKASQARASASGTPATA